MERRINVGRAAFSDEQVRVIKQNLILGVSCGTLARMYRVGEETIGRIRRGLTYTHVVVKGEEKLRPVVIVEGLGEAELRVLSGMTEEEEEMGAAASLAKLQAMLGTTPQVINAELGELAAE